MEQTVTIRVEGKVQGVYFRKSAQQKARALGLNGEVKNNNDGTVGIVATGNESALREFIEWCRKGPERAVVTNVIVENTGYTSFEGFHVVR